MKSQEDTLLSLIQSDAGRDFISQKSGWTTTVDACTWFGISCNAAGEVTGISLTGYSLQATLPSALSKLSNLQNLILTNCDLSGTIPSVVTQIDSLRALDLSLNHLTGDIPTFSSTKLTILSLAHNMFSGPIPPFSSMLLPDIITIDLNDNQISGTVAAFPNHFASLRHIDLSRNKLEGFLEALETQELPSLTRLYLSENYFYGTLPPRFSDSLKELHVQNNQLTGTVPAAMATMSGLQVLLVHNNRLTGAIPEALCSLRLNTAFFATDSSTGVDEDGIGRRRRLDTGERLGCSSIACPAGFFSATGQYPCTTCEDRAMNPYLGASNCNQFAQGEILDIFHRSTGGEKWSDRSWNDTKVPMCSRTGVTCNGEGSVVGLNLRGQGLSGTLPLELGFLPNLVELDLSHNYLSGHVPEELALAPLESILLSENNLSGYVPESLCRKRGINGNGQNDIFSCDNIACPMGTHHPEGHATPDKPCRLCPMVDGLVLANTGCGALTSRDTKVNGTNGVMSQWSRILLVSSVASLLIFLGFLVLRRMEAAPGRETYTKTQKKVNSQMTVQYSNQEKAIKTCELDLSSRSVS